MSRESKRSAASPLSDDGEEKRLRISGDSSFLDTDTDPEATVIDTDFLSSTVLDRSQSRMTSGGERDRPLREELKAALCDPDIVELVSKVIAA